MECLCLHPTHVFADRAVLYFPSTEQISQYVSWNFKILNTGYCRMAETVSDDIQNKNKIVFMYKNA